MLFVLNNSFDPAYNLATEEYLLKQKQMPAIMLWQNDRSIIIGKNQNTMAEINYPYVNENGITVCRRLTGGGAVFHDKGNLNYTVISDNTNKLGDYSYFSQDLTDFLKTLGLDAEMSGRNDVLLCGKKICGNAQTTYKNLVLHHGCILFSADLSSLSNALKVNPAKIADKGIKSVKSRVVNIRSQLKEKMEIDRFRELFGDFMIKRHSLVPYELTDDEKNIIKKLKDEKYSTYEWNYGTSPQYSYS
ncbi:MAG: lipoate--protein ligase family protein, partial [Oscillospiraceae bacterium]|nr:lipoate--protein ligase family protein [Candidatus Equicaccousia limihippi]